MNRQEFTEQLRDALTHLYDPNRLRKSSLISLLSVADRSNPPLALQRILLDTIASMEPAESIPSSAHAWRVYDLLFCRYVQQLNAQIVADQLGLSVRHLRREQRAALESLAYKLEKEFNLDYRLESEAVKDMTVHEGQRGPAIDEELAWLKDAPLEHPSELNQELSKVLELTHPLSVQYQVQMDVRTSQEPIRLVVHQVALNQILLSILTVAISCAAQGQVRVSTLPARWQVEISIQASGSFSQQEIYTADNTASLEIAQRLADLCGCRLQTTTTKNTFVARLTFPTSERVYVLAVDDNVDTLKLLQHYLALTRYRLIGTRDPDQILELVQKFSPQIIILDVMMPQVDGWEVLGRLRQHPLTSELPIVICTILAQKQLALSLGASEFISKPFTQETFLAVLNRQLAVLGERAEERATGYRR